MRKLMIGVLFLFLGATVGMAANHVSTGQIMDSMCAKMGSHNAGYKRTGTHTPNACTLACVKFGADIVTMPYKVFSQLFNHPLTEKGQERFLKDWEQVAELVR